MDPREPRHHPAESPADASRPPAPPAGETSGGGDGGDGGNRHGAPTRAWRLWWHLRMWSAALIVALAGIVAWGVYTQPGQRFVVDLLLTRVAPSLAGELRVAHVGGGSLLSGVTLRGVELTAEGGAPFLWADSVRARYSVLGIVAGRLRALEVFAPEVTIRPLGEEGPLNVSRLLRPRSAARDALEPRRSLPPLRIGTVALYEGRLLLGAPPEPFSLDSLTVELSDAMLRLAGEGERLTGRLERLGVRIPLGSDALRLVSGEGVLSFGDDGITLRDARFGLPATAMEGDVRIGPLSPGEAWAVVATLRTEGDGALEDLAWLDPRLPSGAFSGAMRLMVSGGTSVAVLDGVRVRADETDLTLDGTVRVSDVLDVDGLRVQMQPLLAGRLTPWLGRPLPLDGWFSGQVELTGRLARMRVEGDVRFVPVGLPGGSTDLVLSGTVLGGERPGLEGFVARARRLNYAVLGGVMGRRFVEGMGTARVSLDGAFDGTMAFDVEATHRLDSARVSRVSARGTLRRDATGVRTVEVTGSARPLHLGALAPLLPAAAPRGVLNGTFDVRGRARDAVVAARLELPEGGTVALDGVVDLERFGSFYRVDVRGGDVPLHRLVASIPQRSRWTGTLSVEGRGVRPDSMHAAMVLHASRSRVGVLPVDTVAARMRAEAGILLVDSLETVAGGVAVRGSGRLGLVAPLDGEARVSFATDDLGGLRPLFMGENVIARDTLSAMEENLLRFEGVDVDALPDTLDVRMRGAAEGTLRIIGSLEQMDVELSLRLREAVYGPQAVDSADVELRAENLPGLEGAWKVRLGAHGLVWGGREIREVALDGEMLERRGRADLALTLRQGESVQARGGFAFDSLGAAVNLQEASGVLDSLHYALVRPAELEWRGETVRIRDLEVERVDADPMRLRAEGVLSRRGASDFLLDVEGLHVDRLVALVAPGRFDVGGHLDLHARVVGPATAPEMEAEIRIVEPSAGQVRLTRLEGSARYARRIAEVRLEGFNPRRRVLAVEGTLPLDLALSPTPDRTPAGSMDLVARLDSIRAEIPLAYFSSLEDVAGWVTGELRVRGTLDDPEPEGSFRVLDAAWTIDALGVRHRGVNGTVAVAPDRTVTVDLETRATGRSRIAGTVTLDPLSNPELDLEVRFERFQALDRLDMEGRVSGDLVVQGRYARPTVRGSLRVDQGTLFVDEFARSAEIVDLSDPRLFGADTTLFSAQPLLRDLRNPFLQNLRVEVQLSVPRDVWLRSDEMSVEIGGELEVRYDRTQGDIVLVGELQALRGSYTVLGRTFEVTGGTVGFIGTPGVNPILDIQAETRIRRREEPPLLVRASVEGTLRVPRVNLSTDEPGLDQSDLISYLLFGRPSTELTSGQSSILRGPGGSFGAATGFVTTLLSGAVATQLGAALAQGFGVDYLSITQTGDYAYAVGLASTLANTQVEIGRYVGRDAFIVIVLRPGAGQTTGSSIFAGARVEVALGDDYTAEAFFEDRLLRQGSANLLGLGFTPDHIVGVFIFREIGY